jgi:hypothetical protein
MTVEHDLEKRKAGFPKRSCSNKEIDHDPIQAIGCMMHCYSLFTTSNLTFYLGDQLRVSSRCSADHALQDGVSRSSDGAA